MDIHLGTTIYSSKKKLTKADGGIHRYIQDIDGSGGHHANINIRSFSLLLKYRLSIRELLKRKNMELPTYNVSNVHSLMKQ